MITELYAKYTQEQEPHPSSSQSPSDAGDQDLDENTFYIDSDSKEEQNLNGPSENKMRKKRCLRVQIGVFCTG